MADGQMKKTCKKASTKTLILLTVTAVEYSSQRANASALKATAETIWPMDTVKCIMNTV